MHTRVCVVWRVSVHGEVGCVERWCEGRGAANESTHVSFAIAKVYTCSGDDCRLCVCMLPCPDLNSVQGGIVGTLCAHVADDALCACAECAQRRLTPT
jgi:hypothetical protein